MKTNLNKITTSTGGVHHLGRDPVLALRRALLRVRTIKDRFNPAFTLHFFEILDKLPCRNSQWLVIQNYLSFHKFISYLPYSMRMIAGVAADSPFRQDAQYHQLKYAYHSAPFTVMGAVSSDLSGDVNLDQSFSIFINSSPSSSNVSLEKLK